jgi:hypothetical protein
MAYPQDTAGWRIFHHKLLVHTYISIQTFLTLASQQIFLVTAPFSGLLQQDSNVTEWYIGHLRGPKKNSGAYMFHALGHGLLFPPNVPEKAVFSKFRLWG